LKNPTKVLTDCDNIDNVDGQRMATVLGKHIAGYDKKADNTRVDRVLGVDAQGDIRWTKNIPGGGGGESYTAGNGIDISDENVISADTSVVQPKLTAGTNVTISDQNVISAVDTFYQAGTGLNLTAGNTFNVNTNVIQEKLYSGANIHIDSTNQISATDTTYTEGNGIHFGNNNSVNVYNPVPNSPRQFYFLETLNPDHDGFSWRPIMRTRFRGAIRGKALTATDLSNGYADLKVDFDLNNILTGEYNTPTMYTNQMVFFLFVDDISYTRVDTNYSLYGEVEYIESGIWGDDSDPSFYACELFNKIEGSELERIPGSPYLKTEIRKLGMASRMFKLGGPAFRMHFAQSNSLQVDDTVSIHGYVVGLYTHETYFG
jgi:hypothetical protein